MLEPARRTACGLCPESPASSMTVHLPEAMTHEMESMCPDGLVPETQRDIARRDGHAAGATPRSIAARTDHPLRWFAGEGPGVDLAADCRHEARHVHIFLLAAWSRRCRSSAALRLTRRVAANVDADRAREPDFRCCERNRSASAVGQAGGRTPKDHRNSPRERLPCQG